MAATPDSVQILAQATMKEVAPPPPGGTLTPEQARAKELQTRMAEKKNKTLAGLSEAIDATKKLDASAVGRTLDADYGTERGVGGKKTLIEAGAQVRHDQSEATYAAINEIFGDTLSGTDLSNMILNVETALSTVPGYDYLAGLSAADKEAEIVALLRKPEFKAILRKNAEATLAEGQRLKDAVTEKKRKNDEAEAARQKKEDERTENTTQLTAAKKAESDFRKKKDAVTGKTKATELKDLQVDAAGNPRDLVGEVKRKDRSRNTAQANYDAAVANFSQVQLKFPPGTTEYDDAEDIVKRTEGVLNNADAQLDAAIKERNRRDELETEVRESAANISALELKQNQLINEYAEVERLKLAAQAEYDGAQFDRDLQEQGKAQEVADLVANSAREWANDAMREYNQLSIDHLDELARTAATEAGAVMAQEVKERYFQNAAKGEIKIGGKVLKSGKTELTVNLALARQDAESMMMLGSTGPRGIVEAMLAAKYPDIVVNPGPPPVTKPDERKTQLLANPAAMATLEAEVAKNAFANYVQSGGKISAAQEAYIESQPWGQGLIEVALNSPNIKAKEKELQAKGLLPPGGFREWAKSTKGKVSITILLMIAAGLMAPVAVPYVAAGGIGSVLGGSNN